LEFLSVISKIPKMSAQDFGIMCHEIAFSLAWVDATSEVSLILTSILHFQAEVVKT
jgi:hypothetical protein